MILGVEAWCGNESTVFGKFCYFISDKLGY